MNYIEKYFGHTKPTEILFRNTSTASNLDNMFGSFYYYAKVEAGESERQKPKACVCDVAHGYVDSLLTTLREQPKEQTIE